MSLYTKDQDPACIKGNRDAQSTACHVSRPPMDPKWCAPEPGGNNKRSIKSLSYSCNTVTNCWDKDANPGTSASVHLAPAPDVHTLTHTPTPWQAYLYRYTSSWSMLC